MQIAADLANVAARHTRVLKSVPWTDAVSMRDRRSAVEIKH